MLIVCQQLIMKLTVVLSALLGTAAAYKCLCNNYNESKNICSRQGHRFSEYSCSNAGCCLAQWEIDAFKSACDQSGGGIAECVDCKDCY